MLENKNIFIVGGSNGIGLSLIKQISSKKKDSFLKKKIKALLK